jgi:hypothetical protein
MSSHKNFIQNADKKWSQENPNIFERKADKVNKEYVLRSFNDVKEDWRKYCEYFKSYPDKFIDLIKPTDCKIDLYFYQRIFLRILFRYKKVFITATRGTAKSFTEILALYLKCIMYPGTHLFIVAPGKEQAAKISQDNIDKIWEYYPILKNEIQYKSFSKDYTKLVFHNGSKFDVVQARDSARGGRRNGGAIEEVADEKLDGDLLHSVVIPLMANDRIAMCKGVDSEELHKFQYYVTTAGTRQSFAFHKLQEVMSEMAQGKSSFSIGSGYELPCMHGQLDVNFVMEQKESPTFNVHSFLREYESVWTGSSQDSLVSLDDLNKCRTLSVAEDKATDKNAEYILSYDVARAEGTANANSALAVLKMLPRGDGTYIRHLVNMYSFEGTHFLEQALFLKRKVKDFNARMLVVDSNGMGVGVLDQLVLEIDENPPYSVVNDDRYSKYKTLKSVPMVYALTQQGKNSDIHNIFMQAISNHKIKLLKSEIVSRTELQKDKKISHEKLSKELQPFIMTDLLCEEIMNLEYKQSGNSTQVKQISKSINKDKFSALEYALYYANLLEKQNKVKREEQIDISQFFLSKQPIIRKI